MAHRIPATAVRPLLSAALIALLAAVASRPAGAAIIAVPNGDFSVASTNGTASGILLLNPVTKAFGNNWSATYYGPVASPLLAIGNGVASISGVIPTNGGYFSQLLTTEYQPLTTYTLSATVSTGSLLGLNILNNAGVGIGLTNAAGTVLASSGTSPLVSISLLSGSTYQVSVSYTTGAVASGRIGIRLFDTPGLVTSPTVLGNVTFDNVGLVANPAPAAVPEPASAALLGLGLLASGPFAARRRRAA